MTHRAQSPRRPPQETKKQRPLTPKWTSKWTKISKPRKIKISWVHTKETNKEIPKPSKSRELKRPLQVHSDNSKSLETMPVVRVIWITTAIPIRIYTSRKTSMPDNPYQISILETYRRAIVYKPLGQSGNRNLPWNLLRAPKSRLTRSLVIGMMLTPIEACITMSWAQGSITFHNWYA